MCVLVSSGGARASDAGDSLKASVVWPSNADAHPQNIGHDHPPNEAETPFDLWLGHTSSISFFEQEVSKHPGIKY
jgi:hypothetical protein